jgi:photosystem II stability/assembly factor-like uncharacterized protein
MKNQLIIATSHGIILCQQDKNGWVEVRRGLLDQYVTSVIAREGVILAGTQRGVYRSEDLSVSWQAASEGLTEGHIRWMAFHPDISDFEFAGTEPAGIFISHNGGDTWQECVEVAELRRKGGWYLPYSPEAGCVRGFAFHGQRAYAAVEVGGVLVSDDGGVSWRLADGSRGDPHSAPSPFVHPDVHSIAVHPASRDFVYAPTGGGFYPSQDGGKTWDLRYRCYCRAAWVDPDDPDFIVLGPADGVDRNGRIELTRDGGQTWEAASQGLPVPWPRHMVERFTQAGDNLLAVLSNGELLAAPLKTFEWRQILPEVTGVHAVTIMVE